MTSDERPEAAIYLALGEMLVNWNKVELNVRSVLNK